MKDSYVYICVKKHHIDGVVTTEQRVMTLLSARLVQRFFADRNKRSLQTQHFLLPLLLHGLNKAKLK